MPEHSLEHRVAEDIEGGAYANAVTIWHTGHEFTLDLCSSLPTRHDAIRGLTPPPSS